MRRRSLSRSPSRSSPIGDIQRAERPERPQRPERPPFNRDRNAEGGDRPRHQGYDRSRDRRFQPRGETGAAEGGAGAALPSFITGPTASRPAPSDVLRRSRWSSAKRRATMRAGSIIV